MYHQPMPTSMYSDGELADIYSQARVDYIVPMPMNGKRMRQYIDAYDIDLQASVVAIDREDQEPNGIIMLGVRDDRTWITRLGVVPVRRRRRAGQFLMDVMIETSRNMNAHLMQLEVIKGNEPAYQLFTKLGFERTRELLVIRRAPGPIDASTVPPLSLEPIAAADIFTVLEGRGDDAAWTEETRTFRNIGNMHGFFVTLPDGERSWIVFHRSAFQLSHFVCDPKASPTMLHALIAAVHQQFPMQDTKIENVPADHPMWPAFQSLGYHLAFSRIEMFLTL